MAELLRTTGVVPAILLDDFLARKRESLVGKADAAAVLARGLVRDALLTSFQAHRILKGEHRALLLDKYVLVDRLGRGGMGRVFLAENRQTRQRVAVKLLPSALASDEAAVARFRREAQAAVSLNHDNIVRALDFGSVGKRHFLVMEFVEGVDLDSLIRRVGPLPIAKAVNCISQAAVALQHLHASKLVHRDVKPGNLLLDKRDCIKVVDLGLVRFLDERRDDLTSRFNPGWVMGTADFSAPEQLDNAGKANALSDIYSLGATLFYLLTGRPPFDEMPLAQKIVAVQTQEPTRISTLRNDVPIALAMVIERMMAKRPEDRFGSAAEARAMLLQASTDTAPIIQARTSMSPPIRPPTADPTNHAVRPPTAPESPAPVVEERPPSSPTLMTPVVTPRPPSALRTEFPESSKLPTNNPVRISPVSTKTLSPAPPARDYRRWIVIGGVATIAVCAVVFVALKLRGPNLLAATPGGATVKGTETGAGSTGPALSLVSGRAEILDLTNQAPFTSKIRGRNSLQHEGAGRLPEGWTVEASDGANNVEVVSEKLGEAMAIGLRSLDGRGPATLMTLPTGGFTLTAGKRKTLRVEYATVGEATGSVRLEGDGMTPRTRPLPGTRYDWSVAEFPLGEDEAGQLKVSVEATGKSAAATLYVRSIHLLDASAAPAPKTRDLLQLKDQRAFVATLSGETPPQKTGVGDFVPKWTGGMKHPSAKGQIAAERIDGGMVYAVRTLQGDADAALKSVGEVAELKGEASYVLRIEYKTVGSAHGSLQVVGAGLSPRNEPLVSTDGRWRRFELPIEGAAGRDFHLEIHNLALGPGNSLYVRSVSLDERTP